MSDPGTVLFELGTEELPPYSLETLKASLGAGVVTELDAAALPFDGEVVTYASSRRLAVQVEKVAPHTRETAEVRRGPSLQAAFDADGKPTPALLGFARGCAAAEAQLERWRAGEDCLKTEKGQWVQFEQTHAPRDCRDVLAEVFRRAVEKLPLEKRMRWGARETSFLRPVRWVVLLYDDAVVSGSLMDLDCGAVSRGHRVLGEAQLRLEHAGDYAAALQDRGQVLVDAEARRQRVEEQLAAFEAQHKVEVIRSAEVFEAGCAGAEFPVAVAGQFDAEYLQLPEEVVRAVLEDQQKYFAARDADGALASRFVAIADLPDVDGNIRAGCERVVRSRLQDAAFYLSRDRLRPLAARVDDLGRVVFHRKLGTLLERAQRLEKLGASLARTLDANADAVQRAAHLCKADLGTDIVQSFPKLQGVMGAHYAQAEGESEDVCGAIAQHYRPRYADDVLPETLSGQALALADRIDMLAGVFSIGEVPTGTRDPLGVRRAALGVVRLTVECELDLDVEAALRDALEGYPEALQDAAAPRKARDYLTDRMRGYGVEAGQLRDTMEAVLAIDAARPLDVFRRARALADFRRLPEAKILAATHKRIRNILRDAGAIEGEPKAGAAMEPAEKTLADRLAALRESVPQDCAAGRYQEALQALAQLAAPVSEFFDDVLVMAEDPEIRHNRLYRLGQLQELFLKIADFSRLQD